MVPFGENVCGLDQVRHRTAKTADNRALAQQLRFSLYVARDLRVIQRPIQLPPSDLTIGFAHR